jgi:hypothetical protein
MSAGRNLLKTTRKYENRRRALAELTTQLKGGLCTTNEFVEFATMHMAQ